MCFSRNSLLNGAAIIVRRTLDGALKWALRDLRLEEATAVNFTISFKFSYFQVLSMRDRVVGGNRWLDIHPEILTMVKEPF